MLSKITVLAALAAATLAFGAAIASASGPTATMARACNVGRGLGYGYAYLDKLSVSGTSCATGKYVVRHKGRLQGWSCTRAKVLMSDPVQIIARRSCSSGRQHVTYTYTQNR